MVDWEAHASALGVKHKKQAGRGRAGLFDIGANIGFAPIGSGTSYAR